jgi:predicted permease
MRDFTGFVREHLSGLALPRARELKIVEELAAQIEESYDALVAEGRTDEEAWTELQRQIPDWKTLGDELLDAEPAIVRLAQPDRGPFAGATKRSLVARLHALVGLGLARDLRSGLRVLAKNRVFAATTILTLAVCLGANAAVFTLVRSVLLRSPVPDADRIVAMGDVYPAITPNDILSNTAPSYFDRLTALTALEEQALFTFWFDTLTIGGIPEEVRGMRATPSLFRVLRVNPSLGRAFTDAEGESGADHTIILSHGLWQRLFGGDPAAVGRDVRLGWTGQRYTVVGVMPRGFVFFDIGDGHARTAGERVQFWIPLAFSAAQRSDDARTRYGYFHVGRLRPGATVEQVKAQVDALNAAMFERFPQFDFAGLGMYTAVTPLQDALTGGVRRVLYLLWAGAAFVLLIGVLNITNLSLARATERARELATRLAVGASRFRVTRQLIVEGMLVAGAGGLAGLGVAAGILGTLASTGLTNMPNAGSVRMDAAVAGLILAVSAAIGVLIGLASTTMVDDVNLNRVLIEGGRSGTGGRATRLFRRGLVVTQVALSVVLLMGAGLLLTSFRNLLAVDAGFDARFVTTATIFPPPSRYKDDQAALALSNRILDAVHGLPGVEAAGITSNIALSGRSSPATVLAADRTPQPGEPLLLPSVVSVSPGSFEALGIPLVRGRYFGASDRERTERVAVVDERLAARLWPHEDPIGRRIVRGDSEPYTVVGVVGDVRFEGLANQVDSVGVAYFPHAQAPSLGRLRWLAVRTAAESPGVIAALRSAVMAVDRELPLSDIQTMRQRMAGSVGPQKLAMDLAGMFAVVALFLSVVGVYGVLAYVVSQKVREIGIRIALGSTARDIFRIFFTEGLTLVAAGLVLGVLGALATGRALEGQVFGVTPRDPMVLGAVTVATGIVGLLACVAPAYRASQVDPLRALNEQ